MMNPTYLCHELMFLCGEIIILWYEVTGSPSHPGLQPGVAGPQLVLPVQRRGGGEGVHLQGRLGGKLKKKIIHLDSWVEIVERYEVTFLTDEDVVPHWPTTGAEVGAEVPGLEGNAQSCETVQDRLAGVSRNPH